MEIGINPRLIGFFVLIGILGFLVFGGGLLFPNKNKNVEKDNKTEIVIIERYTTVLVTPTPDGHLYFASEYQNGTRLLKRPFSFIRYNALMKQDMKVTTIVYDYRLFEKMHWFNPSDYKYYEAVPLRENSQFCIIFVHVFMDDIIGDDTRMWAFNRSFFGVSDSENNVYYHEDYPYQLRFAELENIPNFNNDGYVQAFKQKRSYSDSEDGRKTAGEISDEIYYLRGGRSNAIDGYLIFEVPKGVSPEKLTVLGNFYSFGFSQWRLKS